jgi:hypothetical protein
VTWTLVSPGPSRRSLSNVSTPLRVTDDVSIVVAGGVQRDRTLQTRTHRSTAPSASEFAPYTGTHPVSQRGPTASPGHPEFFLGPVSSADSPTRGPSETTSTAACERRVPLCNLKTLALSPLDIIRDAVRGTIRATRSLRTRPPADDRYEQSVRFQPTSR